MRLLLVALAAAALVACSPEPDYERMRASTVRIIVKIDGEAKGFGSGVIVEQGVLTAAHVAAMKGPKGSKTETLVKFKGGEFVVAEVEKESWEIGDHAVDTDLALLTIPTNSGYPVSSVDCEPPAVGETVYLSGHPKMVRWAVTTGTVISDTPREGWTAGRWIQTDAITTSGGSGGPMFNVRGEIIGITAHVLSSSGFVQAQTGHTFGQSGSVICDFLKGDTGIPFVFYGKQQILEHAPGYQR